MEIFLTLLIKLIPLYIFILLGFFAGKYLPVKKAIIASLLINIIVPVVLFTAALTTNINLSTLSIPLLFTFICFVISIATYYGSGFIWKDATKNIIAFTAASANTGYFGLPVAVALFGQPAIGIVALAILGTTIYTNSLGYYIAAKGNHTAKESLIKVVQLPILYAYILGLIVHALGIHLGKIYFDIANIFNGAYVILGMMFIGISLAGINKYKFDLKFIGITLLTKFLLWPIVMILILSIDSHSLKLYNHNIYKLLLLLSVLPLAVNIVPYATTLKTQPEKVAFSVLVSTIFALFYIPLIAVFFLR